MGYDTFLFKDVIYLFLERRERREKERERNINVCLPLVRPHLRTWPATQACALTGNGTGGHLLRRSAINPHQPGLAAGAFNVVNVFVFL